MPDYGLREDGTPKGSGYFGELKGRDGVSTELSFDFEHPEHGKIFAPLLVPSLSREEIDHLLSGARPTDAIYDKAQEFAIQRLLQKKPMFAAPGEMYPLPQPMIPGALSAPRPVMPRGALSR